MQNNNKEICREIGKKIRVFRKKQNLSLEDVASAVYKSKSTLSKYEKGEISIDIETLYELADALHIHVEQLLYCRPERAAIGSPSEQPAFFDGISQFFSYIYDGRSRQLIRCVFDVLSQTEEHQYKTMMYMNFKNYEHYQICENTYYGYIEHYDAVTNIALTNQNMPMEKASVQILASYLDSSKKWGLFNGFSSRPMMPIATKILLSKERLKEDDSLIQELKISREDIRLFKLYNMFPVI